MAGAIRRRALCAPLAVLAAGCAGASDRAEFDDVRQVVEERLGRRVVWNEGSPEDAEASKAVREMLEKPLGAGEAVQIALLRNQRLQATYEDLGVAQASLVQAGLLANPVFDASVRPISHGGVVKLEVGVAEDFLQIFLLPLRRRAAAAEFEAEKNRVAGAVLDLAMETRDAFVRLQADMQLAEMRETIAAATAASYEAAKAIHEAGNSRDLDVDQERALDDRARIELADSRTAVALDRARLDVLMGLWGEDTKWTIAPRLPDVPADAIGVERIEERAIEASLDLAAARGEIRAAAVRAGVTDASALIPSLDAELRAERDDGVWNVGPAIALPIPLFDQGQARRATSMARLRQAVASYRALAVEIRAGVRAAAQRLASARSKAVFYRDEVLPTQTRILNDTQLHYNAMQFGVFQLLAAKRRQVEAGQAYVESLRDYWLARGEFEQILRGRMTPSDRGTRGGPRPVADSADDAAGGR